MKTSKKNGEKSTNPYKHLPFIIIHWLWRKELNQKKRMLTEVNLIKQKTSTRFRKDWNRREHVVWEHREGRVLSLLRPVSWILNSGSVVYELNSPDHPEILLVHGKKRK